MNVKVMSEKEYYLTDGAVDEDDFSFVKWEDGSIGILLHPRVVNMLMWQEGDIIETIETNGSVAFVNRQWLERQ